MFRSPDLSVEFGLVLRLGLGIGLGLGVGLDLWFVVAFNCNENKKFELMLTGRVKAYSSSWPQAVTHPNTNRAQHTVTSFQPKRVTNHATPLTQTIDLSQLEIAKKSIKPPFWRSRSSKVIEFSAN